MNDLIFPLGLLAAAALVIVLAGPRLTAAADSIADRTGLGEAIVGAVLLGASTSLPGLVTSVVAASRDLPGLAVSNALGGIAIQTVFLVIADMAYRHANLEHAAASLVNIFNGVLLVVLLSVLITARASPSVTVLGLHPGSFVLTFFYLGGLYLAQRARQEPMWRPEETSATKRDTADRSSRSRSPSGLAGRFIILVGLTFAGGVLLAESGELFVRRAGLEEAVVGILITSIASSLPELVTTIAAVRRGALTLAVAGILGGNTFDVLFVAASDVAYDKGSIYHAMGVDEVLWTALAVMMTGVVLLGLLARERRGTGNIGFEGVITLMLYTTGLITLVF